MMDGFGLIGQLDIVTAAVLTIVFWIALIGALQLTGIFRVVAIVVAIGAFICAPVAVIGVSLGIGVLFLLFNFA